MNTPRRMMIDGDAFDRSLLESADDDGPPPEALARAMGAMAAGAVAVTAIATIATMAKTGAAVAVASGASSAAASAGSKAVGASAAKVSAFLVWKWLAIGAVVGGVSTAGTIETLRYVEHSRQESVIEKGISSAPATKRLSMPVAPTSEASDAGATSEATIDSRSESVVSENTENSANLRAGARTATARARYGVPPSALLSANPHANPRANELAATNEVPDAASPSAIPNADAAPSETKGSRLAFEVAAIDRARRQVHAGQSSGALATLREYESQKGTSHDGRLLPEARILRIEALVNTAAKDEALRLARDFVRTYPNDANLGRAQKWIDVLSNP